MCIKLFSEECFEIGVFHAVGEEPEETIETIMKDADKLMYIDKTSKRAMKN